VGKTGGIGENYKKAKLGRGNQSKDERKANAHKKNFGGKNPGQRSNRSKGNRRPEGGKQNPKGSCQKKKNKKNKKKKKSGKKCQRCCKFTEGRKGTEVNQKKKKWTINRVHLPVWKPKK